MSTRLWGVEGVPWPGTVALLAQAPQLVLSVSNIYSVDT